MLVPHPNQVVHQLAGVQWWTTPSDVQCGVAQHHSTVPQVWHCGGQYGSVRVRPNLVRLLGQILVGGRIARAQLPTEPGRLRFQSVGTVQVFHPKVHRVDLTDFGLIYGYGSRWTCGGKRKGQRKEIVNKVVQQVKMPYQTRPDKEEEA